MANDKEIEITITSDGKVISDLHGFEGKGCDGAIDDLLDALGKKIETKKKKEYFREEKVKINTKISRG